MRKIVICALLFLAASFSVSAEEGEEAKETKTSFEVMVFDAETDEPIPAAKIKFSEEDIETYTDFDGYAQIKDLTQGVYNIEISFISYKKQYFKSFQIYKATNKLKFDKNNTSENEATYKNRKKTGIENVNDYFDLINDMENKEKFNTHKKKDDLADALLQILSYLQSNKKF